MYTFEWLSRREKDSRYQFTQWLSVIRYFILSYVTLCTLCYSLWFAFLLLGGYKVVLGYQLTVIANNPKITIISSETDEIRSPSFWLLLRPKVKYWKAFILIWSWSDSPDRVTDFAKEAGEVSRSAPVAESCDVRSCITDARGDCL